MIEVVPAERGEEVELEGVFEGLGLVLDPGRDLEGI